MNDALMASAYQTARANFKSAELETFTSLSDSFTSEAFDSIHQASQRAMRLHIATMDLAQKIWAGMITFEKAEEIIRNQFPEFPESTRQAALRDSFTDSR